MMQSGGGLEYCFCCTSLMGPSAVTYGGTGGAGGIGPFGFEPGAVCPGVVCGFDSVGHPLDLYSSVTTPPPVVTSNLDGSTMSTNPVNGVQTTTGMPGGATAVSTPTSSSSGFCRRVWNDCYNLS